MNKVEVVVVVKKSLLALMAGVVMVGAACDAGWEVKPIVAPVGGEVEPSGEPRAGAPGEGADLKEAPGSPRPEEGQGEERAPQDPAAHFLGDWRLDRLEGVDEAMHASWKQAKVDFELRFGPETLVLIIRQGQQTGGLPADTKIPYRVEVGEQGDLVAKIVPPGVSESVSFVLKGQELHMTIPQQPMRLVFARIGQIKAP